MSLQNKEYQALLNGLKEKIRQARVKAILSVNYYLVQVYWEIGNAIVQQQDAEGWGAKTVDNLSRDIKAEFTDMKGLSPRNLRYMRDFATAYPHFPFLQESLAKLHGNAILQPPAAKLRATKSSKKKNEILQVPLAKLPDTENTIVQAPLAQIPWYHHITLLDKVKDTDRLVIISIKHQAMKYIISFLLLLITTPGLCQHKKGLLWKISGNGLRDTSYLFGTIHAIPKDVFFIPQKLIGAFLSSENIVLETGLRLNISDSSLKKEIMMPPGRTLKDLYTRSEYRYLQKYFIDTLKGSIANVLSIKPIWILSVISNRWYQNYVAYESMFINKAAENKKPVIGLEETSDQIELYKKVPLREQAAILLNTIKNRKKEEQNYSNSLKTYLAQDVDQLNEELHSQLKKYRNYYDVFFNSRNDKWAIKISEMLRSNSCFIAVGAGHLGGRFGLIARFQKMGYAVDPL